MIDLITGTVHLTKSCQHWRAVCREKGGDSSTTVRLSIDSKSRCNSSRYHLYKMMLYIKSTISLNSNPSQTSIINTTFQITKTDVKQPRTASGALELHVGGCVSE